jgi:hypothetical protein
VPFSLLRYILIQCVSRGNCCYWLGLDHDLQQKMAGKFDQGKANAARVWIEAVTKKQLPADLHAALKSGVVLCELINAIWPGSVSEARELELTAQLPRLCLTGDQSPDFDFALHRSPCRWPKSIPAPCRSCSEKTSSTTCTQAGTCRALSVFCISVHCAM